MLCGDIFMKRYLLKYIEKNIKIITVLFLFLIIGLVIGIFTYQILDGNTKNELLNSIKGTLNLCKQENFEGINVIKNGMISNLIIITIIYLATITMISTNIICVINLLKGFFVGIYISTLFNVFGIGSGILVIILLIIIPGIVYIPAFIYTSCNAINFYYKITDDLKCNKISLICKELYLCLLSFSIMLFSALLEQFLTSPVIAIYTQLNI
jgi:uncharacterized membrane protein SpoIIM required for sporulation